MDYSNLNNRQLALALAVEVVKEEINRDWKFKNGTSAVVIPIAEDFYEFLEGKEGLKQNFPSSPMRL